MTDRFRIALAAFLFAMSAASIAQANELPADRRNVTVCLYDTLRAQPRITAVDVYVDARQNVVIEYSFRGSHGSSASTDLSVSGPNTRGQFQYVGDFMYPDNPLPDLLPTLTQKCHADGAYVDQVMITGPTDNPQKWLVDMTKYEQ